MFAFLVALAVSLQPVSAPPEKVDPVTGWLLDTNGPAIVRGIFASDTGYDNPMFRTWEGKKAAAHLMPEILKEAARLGVHRPGEVLSTDYPEGVFLVMWVRAKCVRNSVNCPMEGNPPLAVIEWACEMDRD